MKDEEEKEKEETMTNEKKKKKKIKKVRRKKEIHEKSLWEMNAESEEGKRKEVNNLLFPSYFPVIRLPLLLSK